MSYLLKGDRHSCLGEEKAKLVLKADKVWVVCERERLGGRGTLFADYLACKVSRPPK